VMNFFSDGLHVIGMIVWFALFVRIVINEDRKVVSSKLLMICWGLTTIFPIVWLWTYFYVFLFQAIFGSMAYTKVVLGTEQYSINFDFYTSWASLIMSLMFFGLVFWWFNRLNNQLKLRGAK
jgi:hypothetical protein